MTTIRQDSQERLARGYAASRPPKQQRPPFLVDHKLERLLEIRDKDPATYAVFSEQTVATLDAYAAARTAAGYTVGTAPPGRPPIGDDVTQTGRV